MSRLLQDVTAIINTFERPDCLDVLLRSIRRFYPDLKVIVGDGSFEPYPRDDVEYVRLPEDIGASGGRNELLRRVTTPYFLQLDDDMEFTKETHIERLAEVVHSHGVDICGGDVIWSRRSFLRTRRKSAPYHGLLELDGERLVMRRGYSERREGYALCDIVVQFFVARTASVLEIGGWDADLKTEEHEEFFVRAKRHGLTTAHCPDVRAVHWNARPDHYVPYRARDYRPLAARKMGITEWTGMDGQRVV